MPKPFSPEFGPLGEMDIDWRGQLAALARDGYGGGISLETHWKGPNGDKYEASVICARNLRELCNKNEASNKNGFSRTLYMLEFETLHHVAVSVSDLARARQFYSGVLGLEEIARPAFPFDGAWYRVGTGHELHLIVRGIRRFAPARA